MSHDYSNEDIESPVSPEAMPSKEKTAEFSTPNEYFQDLSLKFTDLAETPVGFIESADAAEEDKTELRAINEEAMQVLQEAQDSFASLNDTPDEGDFGFDFDFGEEGGFDFLDQNKEQQDINSFISEQITLLMQDKELQKQRESIDQIMDQNEMPMMELSQCSDFGMNYVKKDNAELPYAFLSPEMMFGFKQDGVEYEVKGGTDEDKESTFVGAGSFGTVYEAVSDRPDAPRLAVKFIDLLNIKKEGCLGDQEYNDELMKYFQLSGHSVMEKYSNLFMEIENLLKARGKEGIVQLKSLGLFDQNGNPVAAFDQAAKVALVMEHSGKTCDRMVASLKEEAGIKKRDPLLEENLSEQEFNKVKSQIIPALSAVIEKNLKGLYNFYDIKDTYRDIKPANMSENGLIDLGATAETPMYKDPAIALTGKVEVGNDKFVFAKTLYDLYADAMNLPMLPEFSAQTRVDEQKNKKYEYEENCLDILKELDFLPPCLAEALSAGKAGMSAEEVGEYVGNRPELSVIFNEMRAAMANLSYEQYLKMREAAVKMEEKELTKTI